MFRTFHLRKFITSLGITIGAGLLAGFLSGNQSDVYQNLIKPPLSPDSVLFPVVWGMLYILMGLALYFVRSTPCTVLRNKAINKFALQMFFNFCWPIAFFVFRLYCFSAVWLAVLLLLIAFTLYDFYRVRPICGIILIPYFIWCVYALYLNIGVCILN